MSTSTQSVLWYLENFSFFDVLSSEDRIKLSNVAVMHRVPKDTVIYYDDDLASCFYLVKEGKIKITRKSNSGKEIILALLGPGEVFGELSIAGQEEREEVATTSEDALICLFKVGDFQGLMANNPKLSLQLTKLIGLRLKKIQRRLESLMFRTSEERIKDFLKELADEFGYKIAISPGEIAIPIRLTHDDIGKLTATSRQTVSSVLKSLEKKGIITYDRYRIYVKNINCL